MSEDGNQGGLFAFERAVLPTTGVALAAWFSQAVRAEIAALERDARRRRVELLSGRRRDGLQPGPALFDFELADPSIVPEDASGSIEIDGSKYAASVVSQHDNVVVIEVAWLDFSIMRVTRALLSLDDTGLLRRLADVLEAIDGESPAGLDVAMFDPRPEHAGMARLPPLSHLRETDDPSHQRALEISLGSRIAYIWGPPGTGKTHLLARLAAMLFDAGERVLFASHTHAAIDEALFKLTDRSGDEHGPLADRSEARDGAVLRLGRTADPLVEAFTLEVIARRRASELADQVDAINAELADLDLEGEHARAVVARWQAVDAIRRELGVARVQLQTAEADRSRAEVTLGRVSAVQQKARTGLDRAHRSFVIGRRGRVAKAEAEVRRTETARIDAARVAAAAQHATAGPRDQVEGLCLLEVAAFKAAGDESDRADADRTLEETERRAGDLRRRRADLTARIERVAAEILAEARVIFATLTKCYVSAEVALKDFDTVIVDEISMALPPLLFLAARRARKRVVLVGDFLQLPPIVRSDESVTDERLGTDVFRLAGLADGLDLARGPFKMAILDTQRRMAPPIAELARHLSPAYHEHLRDHPSVAERAAPGWLDGIGPDAGVTVVDTAELHAWSGRDRTSLSRFNLATAAAATQLAALAASRLTRPERGDRRPIGIATPYAAQRRRLSALVTDLGLADWVMAGSVHTFQGGEAELLILDLVLDEPCDYAALTMTNNERRLDMLRLLNVAVTRARSRLVVLGSVPWIRTHAKTSNALGALWQGLAEAPIVPIGSLLGPDFLDRVAASRTPEGWPERRDDGSSPPFELLDESSFFDRLRTDLERAEDEVVALMAYVGEYRWPQVEPWFAGALRRGIRVTLVVPEPARAISARYTSKVHEHLRSLGAVVVEAQGMHGKDLAIDGRVLYTGSLNWASNRGTAEVMWRIESGSAVSRFLDAVQAKFLRSAALWSDGSSRRCPICGGALRLVNQDRLQPWDRQPLKVACASGQHHYIAPIDQREPLASPPTCRADRSTAYVKIAKGRGHVWRCPLPATVDVQTSASLAAMPVTGVR